MLLRKLDLYSSSQKLLLIFLFPLFFVLHGYNENFGLIPVHVGIELLLYYLAVALTIFILSLVIYKEAEKAFVLSFFYLSIFFFFGFILDSLRSLSSSSFISSYSFLLPIVVVLAVFLFLFVKKGVSRNRIIASYIRWLLLAFIIIEIILMGYHFVMRDYSKNRLYQQGDKIITTLHSDCEYEKPDIFFIVLDEYTSSEGLSKYFNFNNSKIDSLFASRGFYVVSHSRSNYNMTAFSLSSTFNYDYLDLERNDSVFSQKTMLRGIETFRKNRLTSFLAKEGYEIVNYGCFNLENSTLYTESFFNSIPRKLIDNQTFTSRLINDLGWRFMIKDFFTGKPKVSEYYKKTKREHIYRNNFNAEGLVSAMSIQNDKPRFVYGHLMLPHDPYYLDSLGNFVPDTTVLFERFDRKDAYINQLVYCNRLLEKFIHAATIATRRSRVVVIEGDHGFGYHDNREFAEREFSNLNAYYFSDRNYQSLYPGITPVNTFRIILNKYFCTSLPLLKDSSFFMRQERSGK